MGKAASLVKKVSNLHCIETVSSLKLATKLNNAVEAALSSSSESDDDTTQKRTTKLNIYLQVNTSGEESKSGTVTYAELLELTQAILDSCPNLTIQGLMTIGKPNDNTCF